MPCPAPFSDRLAELGIELGPKLPGREGPGEPPSAWIAAGRELASTCQAWTEQVEALPRTTRAAAHDLCEQLADRDQLTDWDAWVATFIHGGAGAVAAGTAPPLPLGRFNPDALSNAQLLAATLTLAAERDLAGSLLGLAWLIERTTLGPEATADIYALVIAKALTTEAEPSPAPLAPEAWRHELTTAAQLTTLLRCLTDSGADRETPRSRELTRLAQELPPPSETGAQSARGARGQLFRLADANRRIASAFPRPSGANANAWQQILINGAARSGRGNPPLTLIESKSIPRTGHHHLMRMLKAAHKEDFTYCEQYQEPGCCEATPCNAEPYWNFARRHNRKHVRLVKSHDFELADIPYPTPPGVIRLVQVRQPLPTLASWMEFEHLRLNKEMLQSHGICPSRIYLLHEPALIETSWQLIDSSGESMGQEEAHAWLEDKTSYIIGFLSKWLPLCEELPADAVLCHGTYILRYEDLGLLNPVVTSLGSGTAAEVSDGTPERYQPRQGNMLERPSRRISTLLAASARQLSDCEARILKAAEPWAHLLRYEPTREVSIGLG